MAQNDLNATRQYLVREGIGHPDAVKSSYEDVMDSLQPAAVEELSDFDVLPKIESYAVPPETELRDAGLTRPAGDVASVRSILSVQQASPQQDSLVQDLPSRIMSLHGPDELVLPNDAHGQLANQSNSLKKSIAVQAKQLGLSPLSVEDQDLTASDNRVKTVDDLLNIKLSATRDLLERSKHLTGEHRLATSRRIKSSDADMLIESAGRPEDDAAPVLFPRLQASLPPGMEPTQSRREVQEIIYSSLEVPRTPSSKGGGLGPDMRTFDRWQHASTSEVSPATDCPPSSLNMTVDTHMSLTPDMQLDKPLLSRLEQKPIRPIAASIEDPSSDSMEISNQLKSFRTAFASEDKDTPMLDSGSLADPATAILHAERAGNPDVDMLLQVPSLSSPRNAPSPVDAGPETPKDHDMTAIAEYLHLKPANDMALLNLNLPNVDNVLGRAAEKGSAGALVKQEALSHPGPQRYVCYPPAGQYDPDDDDEIDELMSTPSERESIQFTPPEIARVAQAAPDRLAASGLPENIDKAVMAVDIATPQQARDDGPTQGIARSYPILQEGCKSALPTTAVVSTEPAREQSMQKAQSQQSTTVPNTQAIFDNLDNSQLWKSAGRPSKSSPSKHNPYKHFTPRSTDSHVSRTPGSSIKKNPFSSPSRQESPSLSVARPPLQAEDSISTIVPESQQGTPKAKSTANNTNRSVDAMLAAKGRKKDKKNLVSLPPSTSQRSVGAMNSWLSLRSKDQLIISPSRAAPILQQQPALIDETTSASVHNTTPPALSSVSASAHVPADLAPSNYKPDRQTLMQLSRLPVLRCYGSFRLLQNGIVGRALLDHQIDVIYPEDSAKQAKKTQVNTAFQAATLIQEPDIILSPRSCAIFYKLCDLFKLATVQLSNGTTARMQPVEIIMQAIGCFTTSYDQVYIILEAFQPADIAGNIAPSTAAFTPPVNKSLDKLRRHVEALRTEVNANKARGQAFAIEICFAGNAHQAAEKVRERIDAGIASEPGIGQLDWDNAIRLKLGINRLLADLICLRITTLQRFASLEPAERTRIFGDLLGPSIDDINDTCYSFMQRHHAVSNYDELEEEDPLAAERAHESFEELPEAGPITASGYIPEPALQAFRHEQEEMESQGDQSEEANQAMLQRQMEEYQHSVRQGYWVGVENQLESDGSESSSHSGAPYHETQAYPAQHAYADSQYYASNDNGGFPGQPGQYQSVQQPQPALPFNEYLTTPTRGTAYQQPSSPSYAKRLFPDHQSSGSSKRRRYQ